MIRRVLTIAVFMVFICGTAYGWQADISVSVQNAENRLTIGQADDATDGVDGRYEIPALLSGDVSAYIVLEGDEYWREIKAVCEEACAKSWDITAESSIVGSAVSISWNPADLPKDMVVTLSDLSARKTIDMKAQKAYSYKNSGKRQFRVEAKK